MKTRPQKCYLVIDDEAERIDVTTIEIEHAPWNPCNSYPRITLNGYLARGSKLNCHLIEKVIFNDPATIVFWFDGTKTVVKCQEGDEFSKEHGLAMAISKKFLGNKSNFNKEFAKWI